MPDDPIDNLFRRPMTFTLVVIDLQPGMIEHAWLSMSENVLKEIRSAREKQAAIIFLELIDYPPTVSWLCTKPQTRTHQEVQVMREYADGSDQVVAACKRLSFATHHFRICGMFAHACVFETTIGLSRRLPQTTITVIKSACDHYIADYWGRFETIKSVRLEP